MMQAHCKANKIKNQKDKEEYFDIVEPICETADVIAEKYKIKKKYSKRRFFVCRKSWSLWIYYVFNL